jgi:hypothetical protein
MPGGSFMVEVSIQHVSLKPGAKLTNTSNSSNQLLRDLNRIAQLEQQLQTSRNPQQAAQHMMQLQQAMAQIQQHTAVAQIRQAGANSPLQYTTQKKTIEFHAGDTVTVRKMTLPTEYDEKGQPKKYTTEELRKLKGSKPSLPGYEASLEDLTTGTVVKVIHTTRPKSSLSAKKEEKDATDTTPKTAVNMIQILGDDPNAKTLDGGNQKPKK